MKIYEKDSGVIGGGRGIIYVNGKYYMLSEDPSKVCVSEDLDNWIEYDLKTDYVKAGDIAYGNGTFVIVGAKGSTNKTYIYYSKDGINWIPQELPTTLNFAIYCNSVKFINNKFIIVTSGWQTTYRTGSIITKIEENVAFFESKDGINWNLHLCTIDRGTNNNYKNASGMDIAFNNNTYIYVGNNGNIYSSGNLDTWIKRDSKSSLKLVGISYGKGQFVITGDEGTILTSKDGINWTKQESGTDSYLIRSRYANGMYIAVGYNGTILQSTDGINWINISSKDSGVQYGLAYNNEKNLMVITSHHYGKTKTIPLFYFDTSREIVADDSEDSTLFFFSKELEMLGIIDYFISLRWRRKYFEAGEFEIVLPVTDYVLQFIQTDILIMRNNYTEAGIIETIEFADDGTNEEVTLSGRFLSCIFERRIIKSKINFSGNTIEGMNTIVNAMTPFTQNWETEQVSMGSPTIVFQATYKNVYNFLCKLSTYSNIAFRIVPNVDSKVYMFEVWSGKDRSDDQNINERYSFTDDNYNIEQGKLTISNKTVVNYVLVGGTGEDSSRKMAEIDKGSTGFDLHELFDDQKSLSNSDVSDSTYRQMLIDSGNTKINEDGTFTLEVTATSMDDYKTKWDLGEIVNLKKEKWGISKTYRIVEVEETIEDGKRSIYPTFGSPLSSVWEDED